MTASARRRGERVERLLAVGGERHVVVLEPQRALQRPPHGGLVVDHQYARHAGKIHARAARKRC